MAETLKNVDIETEEEQEKFEAMMRLESMKIKLGHFDEVAKKLTDKLPITHEVHEGHEEEDGHPEEFDSELVSDSQLNK